MMADYWRAEARARDSVQWKLAPLLYAWGDDDPMPEVTIDEVCQHFSLLVSRCSPTYDPRKIRDALEVLRMALPRIERPWLYVASWLGLEVEAEVPGLTADGLVGAMEIIVAASVVD